MEQILNYKGEKIKYDLVYRNQKNIVLSVNSNKIRISAPFSAQVWEIEAIIYKNIKKIMQLLNRYENHKKVKVNINNSNKGVITIFGEEYNLVISEENINPKIINKTIHIKKYDDTEEMMKKLWNFLKIKFAYKFELLFNNWLKTMDLSVKNFSLKIMTRKWGVCYPKQEKIVLNIKLIHFPFDVIEYVIIHELTHLLHPNHSKYFWYTVERYMKDYREKVKKLKFSGV